MRRATPKPDVVANIRDTVSNASDATADEIIPDDHVGVPNWGLKGPKRKRNMKRLIPYVITAVVFSGITLGAENVLHSKQKVIDNTTLILHGGQTINEKELRSLVVARGLTVYWLGSRPGMKYLLNTSQPSGISLRCIFVTPSSGTSEPYYDVGTFISQNAFALTQKAAQQPNGVGFVNIDGNAVYYDSRDPKNVYIGLKNADIQVEVYDPRPDQALAAALLQGNLKKIT
jgi:hypothetical protein